MAMHFRWRLALLSLAALLGAASQACAQVIINYGGTPTRLSGGSAVSLERETVGLQVGEGIVRVTGRYQFKNRGEASNVTIGLPAFVYGAMDPPILGDLRVVSRKRSLKTRLVSSSKYPKIAEEFYAVTLSFKAGEAREISADYVVSVGAFLYSEKGRSGGISEADYVCGGGSTWKGLVGRSQIMLQFQRAIPRAPLRPFDMRAHGLGIGDSTRVPWKKLGRNAVCYLARGTVQVRGASLLIVRSSARPAVDEVLTAFFEHKSL